MFKRVWCRVKRLFGFHVCMVTVKLCLFTEKRASMDCNDVYPASFEFKDVPDVCSFCQGEER